MKFSRPFIIALAALPIATVNIGAAEARSWRGESFERCKHYTKTFSQNGRGFFASGKACQRQDGLWHITSVNAKQKQAYIKMANHIYDSLYRQGYYVLINDAYAYGYGDKEYRNKSKSRVIHRSYSGYPYAHTKYNRYKNRKH